MEEIINQDKLARELKNLDNYFSETKLTVVEVKLICNTFLFMNDYRTNKEFNRDLKHKITSLDVHKDSSDDIPEHIKENIIRWLKGK